MPPDSLPVVVPKCKICRGSICDCALCRRVKGAIGVCSKYVEAEKLKALAAAGGK